MMEVAPRQQLIGVRKKLWDCGKPVHKMPKFIFGRVNFKKKRVLAPLERLTRIPPYPLKFDLAVL
jgi:hypothetical protein